MTYYPTVQNMDLEAHQSQRLVSSVPCPSTMAQQSQRVVSSLCYPSETSNVPLNLPPSRTNIGPWHQGDTFRDPDQSRPKLPPRRPNAITGNYARTGNHPAVHHMPNTNAGHISLAERSSRLDCSSSTNPNVNKQYANFGEDVPPPLPPRTPKPQNIRQECKHLGEGEVPPPLPPKTRNLQLSACSGHRSDISDFKQGTPEFSCYSGHRSDVSEMRNIARPGLCLPLISSDLVPMVDLYPFQTSHLEDNLLKQGGSLVIFCCSAHATRNAGFSNTLLQQLYSLAERRRDRMFPQNCMLDIPGIYMWHDVFQINVLRESQVNVICLLRRGQQLDISSEATLFGMAVLLSDVLVLEAYRRITSRDLQMIHRALICAEKLKGNLPKRKRLLIVVSSWMDRIRHEYGPEGGRDYISNILISPGLGLEETLAFQKILQTFGIPDCILLPSSADPLMRDQAFTIQKESIFDIMSTCGGRNPAEPSLFTTLRDIVSKKKGKEETI